MANTNKDAKKHVQEYTSMFTQRNTYDVCRYTQSFRHRCTDIPKIKKTYQRLTEAVKGFANRDCLPSAVVLLFLLVLQNTCILPPLSKASHTFSSSFAKSWTDSLAAAAAAAID